MKKIILKGMFIVLACSITLSCKKEILSENNTEISNIEFDETFHITENGKYLIFEDSKNYRNIISNKDSVFNIDFFNKVQNFDFTSNFEKNSLNKNIEDPIGDDYLSSLLNEDWIVQIGDYLYRVNKPEDKVYVLHTEYENEYEDLVNENLSNSHIKEYSTNDEVIELVENGLLGDEKGIFCNDRKANSQNVASSLVPVSNNPNLRPVTMDIRNIYYKGGIIFSLKSEGSYMSNNGGTLKFYFQLENCYYRTRCGSSAGPYSHPWRTKTSGLGSSSSGYTEIFKWYQGSKQLKEYDYKVRLRCENWTEPTYPNPYNIYFTNYVRIYDY